MRVRPAARFIGLGEFGGEEGGDGDLKQGGEPFELDDGQGDIAALPLGVTLLGNAELLGDFLLGKPGLFAEGVDAGSEGAAVGLGWTACGHGRITPGNTT